MCMKNSATATEKYDSEKEISKMKTWNGEYTKRKGETQKQKTKTIKKDKIEKKMCSKWLILQMWWKHENEIIVFDDEIWRVYFDNNTEQCSNRNTKIKQHNCYRYNWNNNFIAFVNFRKKNEEKDINWK